MPSVTREIAAAFKALADSGIEGVQLRVGRGDTEDIIEIAARVAFGEEIRCGGLEIGGLRRIDGLHFVELFPSFRVLTGGESLDRFAVIPGLLTGDVCELSATEFSMLFENPHVVASFNR